MKARVLIMALMVAFASFANVQALQAKPHHEKKMEFRATRMADKLRLNDSQKEKFIPLYQEYLEAKAACRPQLVIGKELTDKQLKANMEEMMSVRKKSLKIDKKYYKKFAKVLNAKQLDAIFGVKAQMGKRHKAPGEEMKAMPPRHFGKPGAPQGKHHSPKGLKKGSECKKGHGAQVAKGHDCKKKAECKMKDGCKKENKCNKGNACPKADKCKKAATCKKECKKATDCKKG